MKKIVIFLILCFLLILLISCGNNTSNTSCETTNTATQPTPSVSTTQPASVPSPAVSTKQPITTKASITSTAAPTEAPPTSTSETIETNPTVINSGFSPSGFMPCPLFIDYEMPKSCPLAAETVTITLYLGMYETILTQETISTEDSFEIYLVTWGGDTLYRYRSVTAAEIEREKYFITYTDKIVSYSHSETVELPLSIFTENAGNLYWYSSYMKQGETWDGTLSVSLAYEKTDGETIVFYPHHLPLPTPNH